jgi:peptide/nickel transport system permease protein
MTISYLLGRLALIVPTALLASMIVFGIMRVLPGDVAATILSGGGETTHSPEVREALREELGLNDHWLRQYGGWLWNMVNGNFGGDSLIDNQSIRFQLARQLPITGLLALYTLAASILIWVPLGIIASWQRDRWPDYFVRLIALPGQAVPSFLLALLAILGLLLLFGWSPPIVYTGPLDDPWNHALMVFWPVLLLTWEFGAHIVRVTRASMLETLSQPYIVVAQAKGLPERSVLLGHALRNALLPIITVLGVQFGALLGGTLILESIFGLPGIGRGLVDAALTRDFPVVQSLVTLLVVAMLLVNLLLDLAYARADPRVSYTQSRSQAGTS